MGEPGQGWRIAMHMLTYERGPADMGWVGRLGQALGAALDGVRLAGERPDEPLRRAVARSAAEIQVLQWHIARSLGSRAERRVRRAYAGAPRGMRQRYWIL